MSSSDQLPCVETSNALVEEYNHRARGAARWMLARQVLIQILTLAGGIIIARVLTPTEFGVFALATFAVNAINVFGDFGIAPSLLQRKEELSERDLRIAFSMQCLTLGFAAFGGYIFAPSLLRLVGDTVSESSAYIWLVRSLLFALLLQPIRSVTMLRLERELSFGPIATIDICSTVAYQLIAVAFVLAGFGVWSLAAATIGSQSLASGIAYSIRPWRIGFELDKAKCFELLRFGVPFQLNELAATAASANRSLIVGYLLGAESLGFLTWGLRLGTKSLQATHPIKRVAFPHLSRLADRPDLRTNALIDHLKLPLFLCGVWVIALALCATNLVLWIYGEKWAPAAELPAIAAFAASLASVEIFATALAQAAGKPGVAVASTLSRAAVGAILTLVLVPRVGAVGFLYAAIATHAMAGVVLSFLCGSDVLKRITTCWVQHLLPAGILAIAVPRLVPGLDKSAAGALAVLVVSLLAYSCLIWRTQLISRLPALKSQHI